jgi:hypothetical protein
MTRKAELLKGAGAAANGAGPGAVPRVRTGKPTRYEQLRVIASPEGLVVKDALGQNLQVIGVDIRLRPGLPPVMMLSLVSGPFDVAGVPQFLVSDPATGQPKPVKRVQWHDGTEAEFPEPPAPAAQAAAPAAPAPEGGSDGPAAETPTGELASPGERLPGERDA